MEAHGKEVRINFFILREVYLESVTLAKSISKVFKKNLVNYSEGKLRLKL